MVTWFFMNYNEAYNEHINYIEALANTFTCIGYDKDDMVQEFSEVLMKCVDSYNGKAKFTTYLYRACANWSKTLNVRAYAFGKHTPHSLDYVVSQDESKRDITLGETIECVRNDFNTLDRLDTIKRELDKLPRGYITVELYWLGCKQVELAEKYGLSQARIMQINNWNIKKVKEAIM